MRRSIYILFAFTISLVVFISGLSWHSTAPILSVISDEFLAVVVSFYYGILLVILLVYFSLIHILPRLAVNVASIVLLSIAVAFSMLCLEPSAREIHVLTLSLLAAILILIFDYSYYTMARHAP